jgi:hypothetical protein
MNGVESFLWNINNLMENFPRIGLILISTSEAEIRGLVGRRLFSRLSARFWAFFFKRSLFGLVKFIEVRVSRDS